MNQEASQELEIIEKGAILTSIVPSHGEDLDIQITTAKKYPRSIERFQTDARSMATLDEDTAASCFYVLPRSGKKIEGPGIRLAEIVALAWGNLRYGARVVGEDEERRNIIAEGFAHDLQSNNRVALQIKRRITDKFGKRYNEDMVTMTGNAACSIALRNAIFKIIPMTYVNQICAEAKRTAIGDIVSLSERREKMITHFAKIGVTKEQILEKLNKPSIEDIDLADLETMIGISTAIKDGQTDIEQVLPKNKTETELTSLIDKVKNKAQERLAK